jgi:surface polysaccharide O-acyltransferase-like enzyme
MPKFEWQSEAREVQQNTAIPSISARMLAPKSRLATVDAVRVAAIFAVICLHTEPFSSHHLVGYSARWQYICAAISYASRFAVPFFFCISGYFWGRKIQNGQEIGAISLSMAQRVASNFLFWTIVYWLLNGLEVLAKPWFPTGLQSVRGIPLSMLKHPGFLLGGGVAEHLWFLPALLSSVAIAWLFLAFRQKRLLIVFSIVIYIIGVLARSYSETSFGIPLSLAGHPIDTRNGPFFGTIFFVSGYWLSEFIPQSRWLRWGLVLLFGGLLLQGMEIHAIHTFLHALPIQMDLQDYVFGTYAMGLGATLVALAPSSFLSGTYVAHLGRLTLGIYCVHQIFVLLLGPADRFLNSPAAEVAYPIVVLLLSVAVVTLLSKSTLTRRFAM